MCNIPGPLRLVSSRLVNCANSQMQASETVTTKAISGIWAYRSETREGVCSGSNGSPDCLTPARPTMTRDPTSFTILVRDCPHYILHRIIGVFALCSSFRVEVSNPSHPLSELNLTHIWRDFPCENLRSVILHASRTRRVPDPGRRNKFHGFSLTTWRDAKRESSGLWNRLPPRQKRESY